jgi:hypothetical protein
MEFGSFIEALESTEDGVHLASLQRLLPDYRLLTTVEVGDGALRHSGMIAGPRAGLWLKPSRHCTPTRVELSSRCAVSCALLSGMPSFPIVPQLPRSSLLSLLLWLISDRILTHLGVNLAGKSLEHG